ncbi:MAG: ABC transporter permease [Nitrospinae bacterium RIFCSPLOWO2_02_FULL_39_110]|nr:MAG: ABC transporter permease [Nitrospinae bacterium RIFCSPHIGHO2_12_FULL_39_42]OGV99852.1 MAG: ABC transporter permease [Nitrospinae bacterium RIFCSPHIGHO2_02_FULL_39_82]OGW02884.1 MAG: ABC transporter permease [Nitrospinae bacterium RIFCSPLOWO2_02_39_17]OGW05883.1 MAG: ABC transporter permease [Nitrospinae bacterium RIFCSPLOWO2_02_FULL_39_110]OGW11359.1 MAG: ABC transporter permease [Nitrospinae bacterium RIFCSPLOWO2_12_39_15]OGW11427.1 MAG: ABC transporter permease [Nitrospinae bacterium
MAITIFFILWIILLFLNTPVFLSILLSSIIYLLINGDLLLSIPQKITSAANSFPLLAAPFFILAGNIMNTSGITNRIFNFADALIGHIPGGLAHANVIASMIFSGMSGAAVADAGGLGAIEIKAMRERNYDMKLSTGITAASAIIGPIIPPSVPMVFYGVLSGASIGALFIAGIIPGVIIGLSLMIMVYYMAVKNNYPRSPKPSINTILNAFKKAFLPLLTPLILIGGIIFGIFTPTEAAVVASIYALLLGGVIYREINLKDLNKIFINTVETTAIVMFLVMTASLFGWIMTMEQIPQELAEFLLSITLNKFLLLLIINLFLLFIGCFMESLAAMIVLVPVLMPIATEIGVDPVHFGIILILNLMIGTLTPPVGIVLYVVSTVSGLSFEEVTKGTLPFLIPLIIVLLLVTYIPELSLLLPKILIGYN